MPTICKASKSHGERFGMLYTKNFDRVLTTEECDFFISLGPPTKIYSTEEEQTEGSAKHTA